LDTEKKVSTFQIGKDPYEKEDKFDNYNTEEIFALNLYNTPHNYVRVKIGIKNK
jgi:hypothetical protein